MRKLIGTIDKSIRPQVLRVRQWLRGVMPQVAIAAAMLFVLRLLFGRTWLYSNSITGVPLGVITFLAIFFTLTYYGIKSLLWLKRRLLWRVRRRLVVTYLFVGLTPIVLLTVLGLFAAFVGSNQAMARLVTTQLNATERQMLSGAHSLATDFANLPGADEKSAQAWLDERAALLRATLPGARIAAWRGAVGTEGDSIGFNAPAQFTSEPVEENTRGVGDAKDVLGEPMPAWLGGQAQWSALVYILPEDKNEKFASPSLRAMARSTAKDRTAVVLVIVPVSRALVQEYRETTGIYLRPFFLNAGGNNEGRSVNIKLNGPNKANNGAPTGDRTNDDATDTNIFKQDQFGEPVRGTPYIVLGDATNWANGKSTPHVLFLFDWSLAAVGKQFLAGGMLGTVWQQVLKIIGIIFLILELLALLAAAWMTRAVTGTVHKLHRATEFIKAGNFSHRVHVRSHDQLGELASAFNDMSGDIEALLEERVVRERLEREVEIAAEVQARLFPGKVPDLLTVEIAAECRAARGVAGDYYDYIEIAPGLVALALGDVSGKGVSASLVMSNLQASLRAQAAITTERLSIAERAVAASAGGDNNKVLARVMADADVDGAISRNAANINRQLCVSTEDNRFATLFLALYEDRTRTVRYTNAGHNPPLLVRADGTAERLTTGGMMVGAFDWAEYKETCVTLEPGALLVIFSDGISEAENDHGEEYGEERLVALAIKHRHLSAHDLRQAIFDTVDGWAGQKERDDDQTLLIVKACE